MVFSRRLAFPKPSKNHWTTITKQLEHQLVSRATFSATGPSKLVAVACHFGGSAPPVVHPGGWFWHLGSTLNDHGSSMMDMWGSGIQLLKIWERFGEPSSRAFWRPRANIWFFPSLFSGHFSCRCLSRNPADWGFQNQVFALKVLQKASLHISFVNDAGVEFCRFSKALWVVVLICIALETGLKINDFDEQTDEKVDAWCDNLVFFVPWKR